MNNKSWIIILIMGIALSISIGYSIVVSQRNKEGESTVTTTSIIEMTATTVTIKNTLAGTGIIEYKEKEIPSALNENLEVNTAGNEVWPENVNKEDIKKIYQIKLSIEDKDLSKVKEGQDVEISIKKEEEFLAYQGKVIKINKDIINNKSTINVEILNIDDKIQENMQATCKVIIEKAENVVALPVEAIQKNENNEEIVDVVQPDGTTKECKIKTGLSDDYYVEITEGLKVGDRVQIVKSSTTVVEKTNKTSEK